MRMKRDVPLNHTERTQHILRIGIDVTHHLAGGGRSGVEGYVDYLVAHLPHADVSIWSNLYNAWLGARLVGSRIRLKLSRVASVSTPVRLWWQQLVLPLLLWADRIDVLLCPSHVVPFFSPAPRVLWIQSIGPVWDPMLRLPFTYKEKLRWRCVKYLMIRSARWAEAVVFETEYMRQLFVTRFGIAENKSTVLYVGATEQFRPVSDARETERVLGKYSIDRPFVLSVSHLYRYKNVVRLILAFEAIVNQIDARSMLVLAGRIVSAEYYRDIAATIARTGLDARVKYIGSVGTEDLSVLYSACEVFAFPSPCESFAYTLVEAMACGAPVVCANTTAMPETCGDAAGYFDPEDVGAIAESLLSVIRDADLRSSMRRKSIERAAQFGPRKDHCAALTKVLASFALRRDATGAGSECVSVGPIVAAENRVDGPDDTQAMPKSP